MNIVITASVTAGADIFHDQGRLQIIPDSELVYADLTHIDAVIMRSQSKVTVQQVNDTQVKFIGSATAGLDHLPVAELKALGIHVVNAPGCNANSVADYWLSAMCALASGALYANQDAVVFESPAHAFQGKILGIVGYGEVGQRVAKRATALGLRVIVNDPPRAAQHLPIPYPTVTLSALFEQADLISLHVPFVSTGLWPTLNLVNAELLAKVKPGATFINTARGDVCDATALVDAKQRGLIRDFVIDVWPHEPDVDLSLWQAATIATPHIAGHSHIAKWRGTWQVYTALLRYLSKPVPAMPKSAPGEVSLHPCAMGHGSELVDLWHYVQSVYDITEDHRHMHAWLTLPASQRMEAFSHYRRHYPMRSELCLATLPKASLTPWQREVLLSADVTLC